MAPGSSPDPAEEAGRLLVRHGGALLRIALASIDQGLAHARAVDIDPASFNLDPDALPDAITPRTRAVMPVHLYGLPADMQAILAAGRE